ncbi:MAG: hypothetical protein CMJ47_13855 [Planctomyces sp.]|nr:hypothetical protein [Planctomyces sp.]
MTPTENILLTKKRNTMRTSIIATLLLGFASVAYSQQQWSGVYPHLTMRNNEGECGTGAVVPWLGRLWAITYAPHMPNGSSDKLYEVTPELEQFIFAGSVGGTPANRMIHAESNQLLIGPYLIDAERNIRVLPPSAMVGRLTANARHLTDPANKVYYATMEEGLYEVDVRTLDVHCLIRDGNGGAPKQGVVSKLPGYHGKGLYSGQDRLVYANNGDRDPRVKVDPTVPSGALAQWQGTGDWQLVRRNQFTEVTGPNGIHGSDNPEADPIWAMGWDARSLILALLEDGEWSYFRLPKGSHSYDGAHGWNTEWPRIREIGEDDLLATMHGTFWRFPASFSRKNSAGIAPRSNYLKVIGDFCRWNDRIVLGCDDSAASEFLNIRAFKAKHASPGQSNSNLWFIDPEQLDQFGPVIGRGSVWLREDVQANTPSDPYLFSGYDYRQLHLTHHSEQPVTFVLEVDAEGNGQWKTIREFTLQPDEAISPVFPKDETGSWIRLVSQQPGTDVTAHFQYRNRDSRSTENADLFAGIAKIGEQPASLGLMRSLAFDRLGLVAADNTDGEEADSYELTQQMQLIPTNDLRGRSQTAFVAEVAQPLEGITVDDASVIVVEDGKRYRLPKNTDYKLETAERKQQLTLDDYLDKHLAIGASVKASLTHAEYAANHAVDGSTTDDSRWIAPAGRDVSLEIDFGKPTTVGSVWIVTGWKESSQYAATDFDLQVWQNNAWKTLPAGRVRGNHEVQCEVVFAEPVTTDKLRITANSDDYCRIYEVAPFAEKLDIERAPAGFGMPRICREVATERDLLNLHGTFYELPARNAQGLAKIRPVATHNLNIHDFCSHNGLLLFTGIDAETEGHHIIRSDDGKAAVWAGVVDDLWELGKPRGNGGPWKNTAVQANVPSDPYLMTAYDEKQVTLTSSNPARIQLEVDIDGTGLWIPYQTFQLQAGETVQHQFPAGFSAYWVRAISNADTVATVEFVYE